MSDAVTDPMKGRIYVVDDDASVRRSVTRVIREDGHEVAAFETAEAFLDFCSDGFHDPSCAIVDLHMPGLGGLELQARISDMPSPCPVVFISGNGDIPSSVQAMRQGAVTFLTKPFHEEDLRTAVGEGLRKHQRILAGSSLAAECRRRIESLSERERETMAWVITGALNKQIAGEMGIAERTVKAHRSQVMEKMGVQSVAELVRICDSVGFRAAK